MAILTKQTPTAVAPRTKEFETARNAALTLRDLVSRLSSVERETLEILLDKKLADHFSKSFKEARAGNFTPIESIL